MQFHFFLMAVMQKYSTICMLSHNLSEREREKEQERGNERLLQRKGCKRACTEKKKILHAHTKDKLLS